MKAIILCILFCIVHSPLTSQNVGIGTTDPEAKLEIQHNSTAANPQLHLHEIGNDTARIKFDNTNGSNAWTIGGYIGSKPENDRLDFLNGNAKLLSMTGDGRLGLGVETSPKTDLHVGEGQRVLFGKDTSGSGTKMMFLPDLGAFRVGQIPIGTSSTFWNRENIGVNSFASGSSTRAKGENSTAMGSFTLASGRYSFASGNVTEATGRSSTAMGDASKAEGDYSFAIGQVSEATGRISFAAGNGTHAEGSVSTAFGFATRANAFRSTAIGSYNVGAGSATEWIDEDPIFEIGIQQFTSNQGKNALTVLKNGKHGIMTTAPKASLHVADDGVSGQGTIVAILEADVSDRPVLLFSETSVGDFNSGMSIEYDGDGSGGDNRMHINKTGGSPMVTFRNDGDVGIGVASPTFALHLPDNSVSGKARAHSWTTYSDQRIKSNISTLSYGLSEILKLKPFSYNQHTSEFKNSELVTKTESLETIGFLAQDVYDVIPEAVVKPEDEGEQLWGMEYEKLIPVLVKAIQEQQEEIEILKARLDAQETKNSSTKGFSSITEAQEQ